MTEHVKIRSDGQAVIPKEICERLEWAPGTEIEIDASGDAVVLRPKRPARRRMTIEEFLRRRPAYAGPVLSIEQMNRGIEEGRRQRWTEKERRSR